MFLPGFIKFLNYYVYCNKFIKKNTTDKTRKTGQVRKNILRKMDLNINFSYVCPDKERNCYIMEEFPYYNHVNF